MNVRIELKGMPGIESNLKSVMSAVADALEELVTDGAIILENKARETLIANGSVDTGALRDSIRHETLEKSRNLVTVGAGTDIVYANRIEHGFVGADSLGRVYNQPPKAFLRPAFDELATPNGPIIQNFTRDFSSIMGEALGNEFNTRMARGQKNRADS